MKKKYLLNCGQTIAASLIHIMYLAFALENTIQQVCESKPPKSGHPTSLFSFVCVQELEAIKARVREMEEEAEKLKELQNEVEKQMNMSPPPGVSLSSISQPEFFRLTHRNIRPCSCLQLVLLLCPLKKRWKQMRDQFMLEM